MSQPNSLQLLEEEAHRHFVRGNYRLSIEANTRLIAEAQTFSETLIELSARIDITAGWLNLEEYEPAIDSATRLLARARQAGNEIYKTWAVLQLSIALARLDLRGRWQEIEPLLLEGLRNAYALKDSYLEVYHLVRLGGFAVLMHEHDKGLSWLMAALGVLPEGKAYSHWIRGEVHASQARIMIDRRDLGEALRYAEMCRAEYEASERPAFIADGHLDLARVRSVRGEWVEARDLMTQALDSARSNGWPGIEREAEYLRSKIERELGNLNASASAGRRCLELARQMHMKEAEVKALISLGQTLSGQGLDAEARNALAQARQTCDERGYDDHYREATLLMGDGCE